MKPLLDAFWRAAAYCLHPRVILLSILPLIVVGGRRGRCSAIFYWEAAVAALRASMNGWPWMSRCSAGSTRPGSAGSATCSRRWSWSRWPCR